MNICPNCSHKEMVGVLFCSECGAQLVFGDNQHTSSVRITTGFSTVKRSNSRSGNGSPDAVPFTDAPVILHLLESNTYLNVEADREVIMGRASEGQSMLPDIDLNPYQAFEAGVSRIHAAIRVYEETVLITDLGSANGTRVNGNKIEPNIPQLIRDGDQLSLGKFKIQVIIPREQKKPSSTGG